MSTLELNAEIYRNLSILADNESYLHQALDALKRLVAKKEKSISPSEHKIKLSSGPTPLDKYVGILSSDPADDIKARDEYYKERYGI